MTRGRIHIIGASGAGTTTLGRALADLRSVPAHDTDDFYWCPTDPPFTVKRDIPERLRLMQALFLDRREWVLSGSLMGWGDPLIPYFDAVILLTLDPGLRMARLVAREARRHGDAPPPPGHAAFLDWARRYDDPSFGGRSRAGHERWLAALDCPVIRLDADRPPDELAALAEAAVSRALQGVAFGAG